jgi:ubiquinone/menaquinone biosynthesis C-methylase UbiE
LERIRDEREGFIDDVAQFDRWRGKRILEVGCGMGAELIRFARAGADVRAIDLTERGIRLARKRLELEGFDPHRAMIGDAENIPFPSNHFELVCSWGVIHHSPDTPKAASELVRVCKPGGTVKAMIYNRRSLMGLQAKIVYGILRGQFRKSVPQLFAENLESPGTYGYSRREARELFPRLQDVKVHTIVTPFDVRISRRGFLPGWVRKLIPSRLGFFLVIEGTKAA